MNGITAAAKVKASEPILTTSASSRNQCIIVPALKPINRAAAVAMPVPTITENQNPFLTRD